jgi:glycosyltransferase involved in cell wall biosynthesis
MQRAVSVVCLALSLIGRSQQKQYIMFYNTVILGSVPYRRGSLTCVNMRGLLRALCIFTTLLGNKATTQILIGALNQIEGLSPTFVLLGGEDYAAHPAPRWSRLTDAWESRYIAREKLGSVSPGEFDALLVNSWELVTEFSDLARLIPAAALMDAVPATVDFQLRRRGHGGWKRSIATQLHSIPFKRAAGRFQYFLPMGSDCADALESDYGISRDRCFVTLAPQDLDLWKPAEKRSSERLRLLFVTNDFSRKGGEFLLRLFDERLTRTCSLTIASNDPSLTSRTLPPGVVLLRGRKREELLDVYLNSDIFVFPTQQDYMPQVLAEALAAGLPCIARDVGGIRDLVENGRTGFLMPWEVGIDEWVEKIELFRSNPRELARMSSLARAFAEQHLGLPRFRRLIGEVIGHLKASSVSGPGRV